jgi:lysophospholipase L1-like esterase
VDTVGFRALNTVLVPDPVLFWSLRPNLDRAVLEGRIAASGNLRFTLSTDADGARRTPQVTLARTSVVFLGDSCTFGVGVDDGQTFAALLQEQLPGVQSVNLGVPGYTAYQGRLRLAQHPFPVPPASVVVAFGFNDAAVWDNRSDFDHAAELERQRAWLQGASRLAGLLTNAWSRLTTPPPGSASPARRPRLSDEEFVAQIEAIVEWCRARRAQPVLVLWPYRVQMTRTELSPKQRALLRLAAADHLLPLVNLIPAFRGQGGESLFFDVIHATPAGHVAVASALEPVLRDVLAGRDP